MPTTSAAVSFSVDQLAALMEWAEGGPLGVSIESGHEELPEVAEFWRQDPTHPAYVASPLPTGLMEVTELDTLDRCGATITVADVSAALAWIEAREREALERCPALF